jgi:hypothetical protein
MATTRTAARAVLALIIMALYGMAHLATGHAAAKVDICHSQPETQAWKKLRVGGNAVQAHLANHDDAPPGGTTSATATPLDQGCTPIVAVPPQITSADATTFTVGEAGAFTVTTTGTAPITLAQGGDALPSGVTFDDNGDGTGTLDGTPAAGTAGIYHLTFTATNGAGASPPQDFTLTISMDCGSGQVEIVSVVVQDILGNFIGLAHLDDASEAAVTIIQATDDNAFVVTVNDGELCENPGLAPLSYAWTIDTPSIVGYTARGIQGMDTPQLSVALESFPDYGGAPIRINITVSRDSTDTEVTRFFLIRYDNSPYDVGVSSTCQLLCEVNEDCQFEAALRPEEDCP